MVNLKLRNEMESIIGEERKRLVLFNHLFWSLDSSGTSMRAYLTVIPIDLLAEVVFGG